MGHKGPPAQKGGHVMAVYVKEAVIRRAVHREGRRCSREFVEMLDRHVAAKIASACRVHNGGRKTVDAEIGAYIGLGK